MAARTVFDPAAVQRLEVDTQSRAFVHSLVDTYRRMLDTRVDRVVDAVGAADDEATLDAAHSLRVSSIMTGAVELAELADDLVAAVRAGQVEVARQRAAELPGAADRARDALDGYLQQPAGAAQESTDSIR